MSDNSQNNKRIAKNTGFLYLRMLFSMSVSLYTSRVILKTLGVEDYGIYNVVGSIITMFSFINGGMVSATQRFLNFELGKGNISKLRQVFSTALQIHALIAITVVLLGETAGLWFLYEKLVIPADRMAAAFWVYQCSIISCAISIISIPYNACIIAHEKMSAFAYISILEVILRLVIVYMLYIAAWDKLITYAILVLIVQLTIRFVYVRYCKKHFQESHYHHKIDKPLFKEMFSFAGWSFWGNLSAVLYTQGLNMMLNIFFGPVMNAARGIAVQVQTTIQQFVSNFQVAINPQITKSYATGELEQMHNLMFRSARFSFLLLYFLTLPILINTEYILTLWLETVPQETVVFTRLMICISLIYTIANPCIVANQATGKVKLYQAVVGGILLLIIPISYIALKLGAPAYSVFIVHFCIESVAQFARMYMLRNLINLPMREYFKNIYIPVISVAIISSIIPVYIYHNSEYGLVSFIVVSAISCVSVALAAIFLGLTKIERNYVYNKITESIKNFSKNDTH